MAMAANMISVSPLHQAARSHPQQIAVSGYQAASKIELNYQQLSRRVIALGQQLIKQGMHRGERLTCIDSNSIEQLMLYWACIDHGIIFCPLSPRFPARQIQDLLGTYRLQFIWAGKDWLHLLPTASTAIMESKPFSSQRLSLDFSAEDNRTPHKIDPTIAANIILTSGSSGTPKAAVHSLMNHIANANGSSELIPLQAGDAWLLSLPLFHIGGLAILNRCALDAAGVIIADAHISLSEQITRDKPTHLSLVSTQLRRLLNDNSVNLASIKCMLLGGGVIASSLLDKLDKLNIASFTSYGMTEMASQITTGRAQSDGSSGQLLAGRELKLVDNNIYVKGDCLFLGYLTTDALAADTLQILSPTDPDGWFCTKDRGCWNDAGKLCILGRSDNMFICGGENLQPEEVEAALRQHVDIENAIVFAEPNAEFGNLPVAIIRGRVPEQLPPITELDAFLAPRVARFKRPRRYYLWPDMEQTSLKVSRLKVIKRVLATSN